MSKDDPMDTFLGKAAEGVYEDGLKRSIAHIGSTLEFLFKSISYYPRFWGEVLDVKWEAKVEEFKGEFEKRKGKIKEENLKLPNPEIAGPIIQALEYSIYQEDLRKLFANLLASSMDRSQEDKVHPAFVESIRQLSAKEAKILKKCRGFEVFGEMSDSFWYLPFIRFKASFSPEAVEKASTSSDGFNIQYYTIGKLRILGDENTYAVEGWICEEPDKAEEIIESVDNLLRLELIRMTGITPSYDGIFRDSYERVSELGWSTSIEAPIFTKFGLKFLETCVFEKRN